MGYRYPRKIIYLTVKAINRKLLVFSVDKAWQPWLFQFHYMQCIFAFYNLFKSLILLLATVFKMEKMMEKHPNKELISHATALLSNSLYIIQQLGQSIT